MSSLAEVGGFSDGKMFKQSNKGVLTDNQLKIQSKSRAHLPTIRSFTSFY